MNDMEYLGKHILVEYYNCSSDHLNDRDFIEKIMNEAATLANATIVQSVFHHFNPYGISGAVIIAESHLSIHTWPEYQFAAVDVFTCGETLNPWLAFEHLKAELKAERFEHKDIKRGILEQFQAVPTPK